MKGRLGRWGAVSAVGMLALGFAACGEDDPAEPSADESSESNRDALEDLEVVNTNPAEVRAIDNSFDGENIQVAPGTRVVWTNEGDNEHDILPSDNADWGVEASGFGPSATYEYTFSEPGEYRYYCSLHGTADAGMTGAIVVED